MFVLFVEFIRLIFKAYKDLTLSHFFLSYVFVVRLERNLLSESYSRNLENLLKINSWIIYINIFKRY